MAEEDIDWLTPAVPRTHQPSPWRHRRTHWRATRQSFALIVVEDGDAWRGTVIAGTWGRPTLLLRTKGYAQYWCEFMADRMATEFQRGKG